MERKAPWWCYLVLLAAVCSVASAGVAFKYISEVPPLTLAAWRLQLTSFILTVAATIQWRDMPAEHKSRFRQDLVWTAFSGVMLALHFGTWVWSLEHTSLAHSLLLVSTTPIIIVAWVLLRRHAISAGEIAGALLAVVGCGVLASGAVAHKEAEVTLLGDLSAFAAAVAVVAHWEAGKYLRTYQPVFVYSAPATALAASLLTLAGFAVEDHTFIGPNRHGVFGWIASRRYAPVVVYLGAVPGVVGHQGFNTVLKYMTPLTVSLAVQFEPVVGPFIGWATGVAAAPGTLTYIGGGIVLMATAGASVATALRQQSEGRLIKSKSMRVPSEGVFDNSEALQTERGGYKQVSNADHDAITVQGLHSRQFQGSPGHLDHSDQQMVSVQGLHRKQSPNDLAVAYTLEDDSGQPQVYGRSTVQQCAESPGVSRDQEKLLPAGFVNSNDQYAAGTIHAADASLEIVDPNGRHDALANSVSIELEMSQPYLK